MIQFALIHPGHATIILVVFMIILKNIIKHVTPIRIRAIRYRNEGTSSSEVEQ